MIGIVVITHGNLAQTLVETASMIMGEQEALHAVSFPAKESLETLKEKLQAVVEPTLPTGCLILTDILGGSASNVCYDYLQAENVQIVTGVNLPMVMEALNSRDQGGIAELGPKVQSGGARGIINMKEFFEKRRAAKKATP